MYLLVILILLLVIIATISYKKLYVVGYVAFFTIISSILFAETGYYSLRMPFLYAVMAISVLFLTGPVKFIENILKRLRNPIVILLLIISLIFFTLIPFYNYAEGQRISRVFFIATFPIMIYLLGIINNKSQFREIYHGLIACSFLLLSVIVFTIDYSILYESRTTQFGDTIEALNVITLGRISGLILLVSFIGLLNESKTLNKLFFVFPIIGGGAFLFLAGTRGAIISLLVSLLVLLIYKYRESELISFKSISLLLILAFVGFNFVKELAVYDRLMDLYLMDYSEVTSGRNVLYEYAIQTFYDNPFGTELGMYNTLYGTYPHNMILEFAVMFGVFGIIMITAIILFGLYNSHKLLKQHHQYIVIIPAIWIYALVNTMFSGDININSFFWNSTILLVVAMYLTKKPNVINEYKANA